MKYYKENISFRPIKSCISAHSTEHFENLIKKLHHNTKVGNLLSHTKRKPKSANAIRATIDGVLEDADHDETKLG